jgi:8-amino-7-oxononanoate synthase
MGQSRAAIKIVATDAVFSMDGDVAPLAGMLALCERHDAWLLVDDAHGVGVLGRGGRGTLDHLGLRHERLILMATLGKALGGYGAFVAGPGTVIDWLVQRARTYVFSTALPPAVAATATAAIHLLASDASLVATLHERIVQWRAIMAANGMHAACSTAIQPLAVGEPHAAVAWSDALQREGFLVAAIRPPTVPAGTSRLRIALSAAHAPEELSALAAAIARTRP